MNSAKDTEMPDLERPPTYSSIVPRQQHTANSSSEVGHTLELHRARDYAQSTGLQVKEPDGNTLYYVGHYNSNKQSSDIILYAGYDSNGPWLAQAAFTKFSKDFKVYVGDQKTPGSDGWDTVRCAGGGGLFNEPSFRFECRTSSGEKLRMYWKKTHDSKLGASRLSPRDFKLVDEGDEGVLAVYVEKHMGSGAVKGRVEWRRRVGGKAEVMGLVVLLSLLEKGRRYMQSVAKAFPNTNSY